MTTLTFTEAKILFENGVWLCLKVNEPAPARGFVLGMLQKVYECSIQEHRKKRSRDANSYMWTLLDKMADVLRTEKEELYLSYVKRVGVFVDYELPPDKAKTFCVVWNHMGTGWPTEVVDFTPDGERQIIRAYYGSSTYNTKQMSRLIDAVVIDCKELGIETMPPDKLAALKEDWRGQHPAKPS